MKDLFLDNRQPILDEANRGAREWKKSKAYEQMVQWLRLKWMPDD